MSPANNKKAARVTHDAVLPAIVRSVDRRITTSGVIDVPCISGLMDHFVTKLVHLWELLGKHFSDAEVAALRELLSRAIEAGYRSSPHSLVTIEYETQPYPKVGISYKVGIKTLTMEDQYQQWVVERAAPLFGKLPDAKLVALATELGEPQLVPLLDVGAGTGRNAISLAQRGHPTTAIERVAALSDEMRKAAAAKQVTLEVIEGDFQSAELTLPPASYKLVVLAEVVTDFRHVSEVRRVFLKLADAVKPGGLVLINAFLAGAGYKPDEIARDAAHVAWSGVFTRNELEFITRELPFDRLSDESAHEYERAHLPPEGWPPTGWFLPWAQWSNVADLPAGKIPVELRWLVYRRRG